MKHILGQFQQREVERLSQGKAIPAFEVGDTIIVNVRIIEGESERIQAYEGVCIAKRNRGLNSSYTVRKISHGEGVERVFPLYSPRVESIKLVRKGEVRRAKLYYMRDLQGKAARIKEKTEYEAPVAANQSEKPAIEAEAKAPAKEAAPKKVAKSKKKDA